MVRVPDSIQVLLKSGGDKLALKAQTSLLSETMRKCKFYLNVGNIPWPIAHITV